MSWMMIFVCDIEIYQTEGILIYDSSYIIISHFYDTNSFTQMNYSKAIKHPSFRPSSKLWLRLKYYGEMFLGL